MLSSEPVRNATGPAILPTAMPRSRWRCAVRAKNTPGTVSAAWSTSPLTGSIRSAIGVARFDLVAQLLQEHQHARRAAR